MLKRSNFAFQLLLAIIATGCSSSMDKPLEVKLNPHPTERYELTVTLDAPGPWESVKGHVGYVVSNEDCTPKNDFEGVHKIPIVDRTFELARVDDTTYRGYFYRDLIRDDDYFGLGICHWEMENVSAAFLVHGLTFSTGTAFYDRATAKFKLPPKPVIEYFSKNAYFDRSMSDSNEYSGFGSAQVAPFTSKFGEPFQVTTTVRKIEP